MHEHTVSSGVKVFSRREEPPTRYFDARTDMQRRIWNMLLATVPGSGFVMPQTRPTYILNLACGSAVETPVLSAYFGGVDFNQASSGKAKVYGIDDKEEVVQKAASEYGSDDHSFIHDDAATLLKAGLPDLFDVVVVRHPQHKSDRELWQRIFAQGANRLAKGGLFLSTSYTADELQTSLAILNELGLTVVSEGYNGHTRDDFGGDFSFDRYVLTARKT